MKTINEGISILRNMYGCWTCGMSKDENGNNIELDNSMIEEEIKND